MSFRLIFGLCLFLGMNFILSSCARSNLVVLPEQTFTPRPWTSEEKARDIAIQTLYVDRNASYHLVRLKGAESPHIHAKHDLSVVIHRGKSAIHFEDRSVLLKVGDIVRVIRGTYHWAENLGAKASEVYAIFSPPFYGEDTVPV